METQFPPHWRFTFPTKTSKFFDELKIGKLMGARCKKCGKLFCPPTADCANCGGNELDWIELSGRGRLLTYTVVRIPPISLAKDAPIAVGIVQLDEGPNVMTRVVETPLGDLSSGARAQVVFLLGFGGQPSYAFKIVPH